MNNDAEIEQFRQKYEWGVAEAMALVLNHEGYIERLRAALDRLVKAVIDHDNPDDAGLSRNHQAVIEAVKLLGKEGKEGSK